MVDVVEGKLGLRAERLKEARVWMSILGAVLVAGYSGFTMTHAAYVNYHDGRYVLKSEALTLAQSQAIEAKVDQALLNSKNNHDFLQSLSMQNAQLSSDFRLYSATMLVNQARSELRAVEQNPESTPAYRALKAALEDRLEKAEEFKECIKDNGNNCNVLVQ